MIFINLVCSFPMEHSFGIFGSTGMIVNNTVEGPGGWSSGWTDSSMEIDESSEAMVVNGNSRLLWYSGCFAGGIWQHIDTMLAPWL